MLPIAPHLKIIIESIFLTVMLGYAAYNYKRPHLTMIACIVLSMPLIVDVFILHAVRPIGVTVMLNMPFLSVVSAFVYAKILRKSWPQFVKKLAVLVMLLFGD